MTDYDVVLIHPPAVYDFRRRPIFPGAMGPSVDALQFIKVPIGMLSVAEYLDRHGYRVILDNIGDRMVNTIGFDVEEHLKSYNSDIFAIGLHFQQHAPGALSIAEICRRLHPGSKIILGGLTATCFHKEIISRYSFVDAVVRAEAEKPMLDLVRSLEKLGRFSKTSNLTYKSDKGEIHVTPLGKASRHLDEFEYTRFDLLEPKTSIYTSDASYRYSLEVCRGCRYNCSICGGSAYTYKKYLGMDNPAFRSPSKIVADMKSLNDQGIFFIGLFQDPRMAGRAYWQELIATIIKEKPMIERLSLDLLAPADEDFIRQVSGIGRRVVFHLCPDTGSSKVRKQLGRHYSNQKILDTVALSHKYGIPVSTFFSIGLAGETEPDIRKTWKLWQQLNELDRKAVEQGRFKDIGDTVPMGGSILGPIVLDPGSSAFDSPRKNGYKLLFGNLSEYVHGLSQPSWHQWLNYETDVLNRTSIVDMILDSVAFTIDQREKYGFYNSSEAGFRRVLLEMDRAIVKEVDRLEKAASKQEIAYRIVSMRKNLDNFLLTRQLDIQE